MRYRFGQHLFDTGARELRTGGRSVRLMPKVFALLEALLERRPEAVAKEELHRVIWPDVHVTDASLARLVSELRSVLGESAREARWIRTVHGFGYAFVGAVTVVDEDEARDRFLLVWRRRRYTLRPGENVLGRSPESPVPFESPQVSRRHCRLTILPDGARIEDLGSKNGTWVRGERIEAESELHAGDVLGIGPDRLVFGDLRDVASTETESEALLRPAG